MKRIGLAVGLIAIGMGGMASAADMAVKAPPPVAPPQWTGFYIGVNVGGVWGNFDPRTSTVFSPVGYFDPPNVPAINAAGQQSIKPSGFVGGAQAGYNWQAGSFLLGGELDIQSFHLSGSASTNAVYPSVAPANFTINSSASTDWLFTARPRVGFVSDGWLLYATGGLAVTELHGNFSFTDSFAPPDMFAEAASISKTKVGYAVGAGVETRLWQGWSLKAEYLFVSFGSESVTALGTTPFTIGFGSNNNPFTHSIDLKANIVRLGLNYHLP